MKLFVRILIGLFVVLVLAIGAALLALPRLLDDERVRDRIEQASRDALGREVRYERLELGFLPPSLRALGTELAGETPQDPPLLEAQVIALRIALWPLLLRNVVVDSLVIDRATLRLTRTEEGIALPVPPSGRDPAGSAPADEPDAVGDGSAGSEGGFTLAVREVALRDSTVQLEDRAVRPAVSWELREIDARLRGESLDAPIDVDLEAALASGGSVAVEGTAAPEGRLELVATLRDVALAPLAPYLGGDLDELAGAVSGRVAVAGPADALEALDAKLSAADVRFRREDVSLRGPVEAVVDLAQPTGAASGGFELDLGEAQLEMDGTFTKPPGTAARVTGRVVSATGGGLAFEDVKLVIKNFEATGRVGSLDPLRVELAAPPFELEGWEALVPALADASPTGRVAIPTLSYTGEPQALTGEVRLDEVAVRSGSAPPIVLEGALRAQGDAVRSEGLVARTADQILDVDARLERLFASPRYQVALTAQNADSNAIVTSLLEKPDTLYGPLGLDATLRGDLGDDPLGSLAGRVDFGVVDGRLVGVSLLQAVVQRLGAVGNLALDLGKAFGGRDLQRFYGDEFELFAGVLDIADGIARTDDLRFVYRGYTATLRGQLTLADLALDMTGDLTLSEEIDREVAEELSLPADYRPQSRTISLAAVQGTLADPRIRLAEGTAVQIAAAYAGGRYGGRLREEVEEELGEGSGELVDKGLEILEGVLGGQRRESQAPAPTPSTPDTPDTPGAPAPAPDTAPAPAPDTAPTPAPDTAPTPAPDAEDDAPEPPATS